MMPSRLGKKLDQFYRNANGNDYGKLLAAFSYNFELIDKGKYRVYSSGFRPTTFTADTLQKHIKGKLSPKQINEGVNYLVWHFTDI